MSNILNKTIFTRTINFFLFSITLTTLATIITYFINPDLKGIIDGLDDRTSEELTNANGIKKVWLYVVNNGFQVPLQMFILSLIPIQFLYMINIILSVSIPGVLFGVILQEDFKKGSELIFSSSPHYVFEIIGFCLFAAVLFEMNRIVRIKIKNIFRKDKYDKSFIKGFLKTIKIYVILVLPIIVLAAFVETYVADIILNLFQ